MSNPALRLFPTNHSSDRRERELDRIAGTADAKTVVIPLGKMVPLLLEAAADDLAWLNDFANDSVRIDVDLYDVLLAYKQMRQSAAA
ncbi:hypothetical protein K227x_23090 [Rubripirellula lacrimiformis]|uniref:Uncharacterized protein n=1 Tax=Rubripirellula lacrimiformis TaxID=1930273 RepID=A0A517N9W1_9BACT|nr:hypothetical protein [Rubripirellula lacrimiformis]QDT03924.1 hypothetical protein K227x_23090 [Rubripirellula lacrimiformis]